ncbi:hypothetical protein AB0L82_33320 [Nocardia sp. NPDC052001]|uniref:hypothetical protein n=1 Tax=Nocardia sp. NPDC052001 TaxID=3154853 RepID=UPI00343D8F18
MRTRLGVVIFTAATILTPLLAAGSASATPANPPAASGPIADSGSASASVQFLCFLKDLTDSLSARAGSNCVPLRP